jgi:DNA-binding CsgD family transcriptional regulator
MAIVGSSEWNRLVADLFEAVDELSVLLDAVLSAMDALTPKSDGRSAFLIYAASDPSGSAWLYPEVVRPSLDEVGPWPDEQIDPFTIALHEGRTGFLALRDVMPSEFEKSRYFEKGYAKYGYCDAVAHGCRVDKLYILVGRMNRARLTDQELEEHRAASPIILAAARRVAIRFSRGGETSFQASWSVEQAMNQFGNEFLTPRERDVIQLILRGHNTESISHQLNISPNTIKRHRSRGYRKFGVGSHGELFSLFLESLEMPKGA